MNEKCDILINELRVTFIRRVTSSFLHMSHELLFIAQATSYFLADGLCGLQFTVLVTS